MIFAFLGNDQVYTEFFPDTYIYELDDTNKLARIQETLTPSSFSASPARHGSTLAYTENCETHYYTFDDETLYNSTSTCLNINGKDVSIFNNYRLILLTFSHMTNVTSCLKSLTHLCLPKNWI